LYESLAPLGRPGGRPVGARRWPARNQGWDFVDDVEALPPELPQAVEDAVHEGPQARGEVSPRIVLEHPPLPLLAVELRAVLRQPDHV
jgi:hypothetical protein